MFEFFRWLQRAYQKFHLSYVLPFVILISYTLLGAAIFRSLELERDLIERQLFRESYYYAFNQITKRILELRCEDEVIKLDTALQLKYAEEAVNWFLDYLNFTTVIHERNASSPWSWYGSMFYAGQLYTTIGYGLPVAKTLAGQIASIFYIMFGIPIFLIILKDVGRLLSRSFRKFYKRLRTTHRRSSEGLKRMSMSMKAMYRSAYEASSTTDLCSLPKKGSLDLDPEMGSLIRNKKKLTHENAFPIPIALAVLILWIGLSAALFCLYEREWGYLTSVYFFFVSISTVGLGDIVPDNKDMMLGYFLLILIGLALLSMCVNLIQVALERILGQLLKEYIDEIERVAAIAKNEVDSKTETTPFEVGMASGLLTVPFTKHHEVMRSFPLRVKDWLAERIANNMIDAQLVETDSDVESDAEMSTSSQEQQLHPPTAKVSGEETQSLRPIFRHGDLIDRLREHIPAIRTVQALKKAKFYTPNDDFQSLLFNKFVTNSKLERYVDQMCEMTPRANHVATQTELLPPRMLASVEEELSSSVGSQESSVCFHPYSQSTRSASNSSEAESIFSTAYYDIQFGEACGHLAVVDNTGVATSEISKACSKLLSEKITPDNNIHRRLERQHRERPKSYQGPLPLQPNDVPAALLPPPPSIRRSYCDAYRRIGSLPTCFQRSSSQSVPQLLLKKPEGEENGGGVTRYEHS